MDRDSEVPLYRQLAGMIRQQIVSGQLRVGDRLPTMDQLVTTHGVAKVTVRGALDVLRSEGLIRTTQGLGSHVADPATEPMVYRASTIQARSVRDAHGVDVHRGELEALGRSGGMTSVTIEREAATVEVAGRLALDIGDPVIVRRRVMEEGGRPSFLDDSWYPASLVEGTDIAKPVAVKSGTLRVLESLGHQITHRREEVTTRMPTPEEARILGVPTGVPVLVIVATEFVDRGHLPVEVYRQVRPGDRHRLVYEIDQSI